MTANNQLPLLTLLEPKQKLTYELLTEAVPEKIAIGGERFWIVSIRKLGNETTARYQIPGQWTKDEIPSLLHHIGRVGWQLKESEVYQGRPYCNDEIQWICEQFCKGVLK